jgi:hypothetical protein
MTKSWPSTVSHNSGLTFYLEVTARPHCAARGTPLDALLPRNAGPFSEANAAGAVALLFLRVVDVGQQIVEAFRIPALFEDLNHTLAKRAIEVCRNVVFLCVLLLRLYDPPEPGIPVAAM